MAAPDKIVRIVLDASGAPKPDQDPVWVAQDSQRIKWVASFPFTIDIENYDDVSYGGNAEVRSCRTGYFTNQRKYKYTITANGHITDPFIEVNPGAAHPHRPPKPPRVPPNLPPADDN